MEAGYGCRRRPGMKGVPNERVAPPEKPERSVGDAGSCSSSKEVAKAVPLLADTASVRLAKVQRDSSNKKEQLQKRSHTTTLLRKYWDMLAEPSGL